MKVWKTDTAATPLNGSCFLSSNHLHLEMSNLAYLNKRDEKEFLVDLSLNYRIPLTF